MVKPWETAKIGDFLDFKNGLNKGKEFFGYGTPIVNYTDVYKNYGLKKADIRGKVCLTTDEIHRFDVRKNDVFFTRTSETPDEVGMSSVLLEDVENGVFSGFVLRGRPKNDMFVPEYCKYCFSTEAVRNAIVTGCTYTTRALTNGKQLSAIELPVPPKPEQEAIAEALSDIDTLIVNLEKLTAKYELIKKACLQQMFPQNGEKVPQMRLPGFTGAWEQRKFEEIAFRASAQSANPHLPRVEYEDIVSGSGVLNKDIFQKESSKVGIEFHKGDVLYGKLRPYLKNWLLPDFSGLAVGDFWVLQPQNVDSSYLFRLIQSRQFDEVANQSTGTKMPRADWKLVSKTEFYLPTTLDEQSAIGAYFANLDRLITLHQCKLEKVRQIKQGMMSELLTGRIRLKDKEDA